MLSYHVSSASLVASFPGTYLSHFLLIFPNLRHQLSLPHDTVDSAPTGQLEGGIQQVMFTEVVSGIKPRGVMEKRHKEENWRNPVEANSF